MSAAKRAASLALACFLAIMPAAAQQGAGTSSAVGAPSRPQTRIVTVTANLSGPGVTIPANFVGISGEVGDLITGFYQGTSGSAASFLGLANMLGTHGILRLGGASSDVLASTPPALTQTIANNLNTFMATMGAGWSLIYGLDLFANNSAVAATQAGLIQTAFGSNTPVFQFGNEVNGYLTLGNFITNWNAYYAAVNTAIPGVKVAAADLGNWGVTQTWVNSLTPGVAGMSAITTHWYIAGGQVPNATMLISTPQAYAIATGFFLNQNWAGTVPLRVSESNSISSAGQAGYSNALVAAAWYLNEAITLQNAGIASIETHEAYSTISSGPNSNGWYNPFVFNTDGKFSPGAIFYGLLLFSKIEGQVTVPVGVGGNGNVNAIATKGTNGNANILVVNNDTVSLVNVMPDQSLPWASATVLHLKGTGCSDTTPVIGDQPIGESGAWSGAPFSISYGQSIRLKPCEAALISILP